MNANPHHIAHLYTALGEFVAIVWVPPFETGFPPVLQWNARTFLRDGDETSDLYHETFAYWVPQVDVYGYVS